MEGLIEDRSISKVELKEIKLIDSSTRKERN
jgi:hypothetical protein